MVWGSKNAGSLGEELVCIWPPTQTMDTVVHGITRWSPAFQIGTHADVDVSSLVVGRSVVKMFVAASNFAQARRSAVGYIQAVKIERSMDWQKTEKTVFTVCTSTRWLH